MNHYTRWWRWRWWWWWWCARFCLLTHQWWAAQRGQACHIQGKSMWASSHSSAGRRLHRNTEDGHRLRLDMAHQAASSPAEERRMKLVIILYIRFHYNYYYYYWFISTGSEHLWHLIISAETLTGQMRETRRPVVAISLSGSKRSLSWTKNIQANKHNDTFLKTNINRGGLRLILTAFTAAFSTLDRAQFELVEEVCSSEDPH